MRLATLRTSWGPRLALHRRGPEGEEWVDAAIGAALLLSDPGCPSSLQGLLEKEGCALGSMRRLAQSLGSAPAPKELPVWRAAEAVFDPPVLAPGAFLDFYAFEEHVKNARARRGLEVPPEWYEAPAYYRSNARAFLGHRAVVDFPPGESMMDFELELAAVLGRPLRSPAPNEAQSAIAGYCLLNDWSARAIQRKVMAVGLGPNKGKDFATSLGPWLVTPEELGPPGELVLKARVNGETWCTSPFSKIRWSFGEMIAFAGEGVRFEPGDVFGSGTLGGGCGLELGRFLKDGDVVELDGGPALGVLAGTVRQERSVP
jgi:fumarylacetoacetate (FAA) hydrolase